MAIQAEAAAQRRSGVLWCRWPRALLRLAALAAAGLTAASEDGTCSAASGSCGAASASPEVLAWQPKTLSVVLPCANEGEFARKTVVAVSKSVPGGSGGDILADIVVVDDGSDPPLRQVLGEKLMEEHHVTLVRHEATQGLIVSKSDGASAATGDIIVFFDCHVAPQKGWYSEFLESSAQNYRRVVVPVITNLNIDTWKEEASRRVGAGVNKCYLTWDADFKWMVSDEQEIPILSGGLLGISRRWWNETGGYDSGMRGWGGENIDQSLRTWLCGGEIVGLPKARVAHMWRTPDDPRTTVKYQVEVLDVLRNRARAAKGWFGDFAAKLVHYPDMRFVSDMRSRELETFREVQKRLNCHPFAWYIWRFRNVYEDAGLLPKETFKIRHIKSGRCLTYMGPGGTHPSGTETIELQPCGTKKAQGTKWPSGPPDAQRFHLANKQPDTGKCCSGLRVWSTDQCVVYFARNQALFSYVCDLGGNQGAMKITDGTEGLAPGQLRFSWGLAGQVKEWCVTKAKDKFQGKTCAKLVEGKEVQRPVWDAIEAEVPMEMKLYEQALEELPELRRLSIEAT